MSLDLEVSLVTPGTLQIQKFRGKFAREPVFVIDFLTHFKFQIFMREYRDGFLSKSPFSERYSAVDRRLKDS